MVEAVKNSECCVVIPCNNDHYVSGITCLSSQTNSLCLDTKGVPMYRLKLFIINDIRGRGRSNFHHKCLFLNCRLICLKGFMLSDA